MVKKFINRIAFIFTLFLFCSQAMAQEWYEGGKLHDSNAIAWQKASHENKLATCADFVAGVWSKKLFVYEINSQIRSMNDLKPLAEELVNGLDAAFEKDPNPKKNEQLFSNQKVSDSAMLLMVMMGWVVNS